MSADENGVTLVCMNELDGMRCGSRKFEVIPDGGNSYIVTCAICRATTELLLAPGATLQLKELPPADDDGDDV